MLGWSRSREREKLIAQVAHLADDTAGRIDPGEFSGATTVPAGHIAILADRLRSTGRELQVSSSKVLGAVNQVNAAIADADLGLATA